MAIDREDDDDKEEEDIMIVIVSMDLYTQMSTNTIASTNEDTVM